MSTFLRRFLLALLSALWLAAGCAYESTQSVFSPDGSIADPSVAGQWTCTAPKEPTSTLTITESSPRQYALEMSAPGLKTVHFRGFITRTGESTVFNVQQIGANDLIDKDKYAAVRYAHLADESLDVAMLKSRRDGVDVYDELMHCIH